MITENNIKRLESIVAKYAMQDCKRVNPYGTRKPYSLSPLTNKTREMLNLARKNNISKEDKITVKEYLLKHKMNEDL